MVQEGFKFAIDRGGTFTDIWAKCPNGKIIVKKLLSVDPTNYKDAPREGIRRILSQELEKPLPIEEPIDLQQISWIRMGTTVATNALLERQGERMALVITQGFKDLLFIGNQSRPNIFDLEIVVPDVLYEEVVEVKERVVLQQELCQLNKNARLVKGTTGEMVEVWQELDEDALRQELAAVKSRGVTSLAVALMHSYTFPEHEEAVGAIARQLGFHSVSLSCRAMPMVRLVPRGLTACADGYLTPHVQRYIKGFSSGFSDPEALNSKVLFMQSDGGLTPVAKFNGARAVLSGPAGGVVGYAMTTYKQLNKQPVIGFDMGGTSTDVSRYAGQYEHVLETTTAGVSIQAPQMDINTVAAGGGSRLFFRSGMFVVGPESAGAHPGPVCYRKHGHLAVTDANVCLGRVLPQYFPKIFGASEDLPLDKAASLAAMQELTNQVNEFRRSEASAGPALSVHEVAAGFVAVANEAMCRPIRALTQAKGYDTSQHVLAVFGGAGGQHACSIARALGMCTVYVHKYAGILSAYGLALADVVHEAQVPCALAYEPDSLGELSSIIDELQAQCIEQLQRQGFDSDAIETEPFLNLRYEKTDCALMCSVGRFKAVSKNDPSPKRSTDTCRHGNFLSEFFNRYQTEFGFTLANRRVLVDDVRVRGVGQSETIRDVINEKSSTPLLQETTVPCYFECGELDTAVYLLEKLANGHCIQGPAIIIDANSSILVEPDCKAEITASGNVLIQVGSGKRREVGTELDSIQLSIFSHRFMSTAEQMGRVLQRTSISTNIKERLDFSCAMFGPDGGLVANAPHIPVHLGAMQETVQFQIKALGDELQDGDVILSNHPKAGGSHLPDLTVITPVFYPGQENPVFFVASRGHHADIGGATPGSMPPHSRSIHEEGAVFRSFFLVKRGEFQEQALRDALNAPAQYAGCTGTRNMSDNLSDLRAQVAANQKGILLIRGLIDEYGLDVVQAYMSHIQNNAEVAVRNMLRDIGRRKLEVSGSTDLEAQDMMDDGTRIVLRVSINIEQGSALFDFTGTGCEVYGNCNAPRAITMSALIYCLRCMVGYDVPLNQGCLAPVTLIVPPLSLLDPSDEAAVVGGNVLTSQRVVDVVLKAFGACAASQGCMNNVTFGDDDVGYYETVAGGAGAGPNWHGRSGVHTHMTNTRITDPEILERRYPVVLKQFSLRPDSGGRGQFQGGDGVHRELLVRRPLTFSVLSERRAHQPYGMNGGEAGSCGLNLWKRANGQVINVGAKCGFHMAPGDRLCLLTPGGGGYGSPTVSSDVSKTVVSRKRRANDQQLDRGSVAAYKRSQESA